MQEILEKLNELANKNELKNNDLVYMGYLCDCLKGEAGNTYVEHNLNEFSEEIDTYILREEYEDLICNEHLNDCNDIFS